jgi:hypothetical protein
LKTKADSALCRFFVLASWLVFVDGTLKFITEPNPLVAGEKNYTVSFTRDSGDPKDFDNVELLLGHAVIIQLPLKFLGEAHTLGPFSGEFDNFIFTNPGCVFIHSQQTHDRLYPA